MQLFPFKAIFPNLDLIASSDTFFSSVKKNFSEYYKNGFYKQNKTPSLYIYEITKGNSKFVGVLGCIDIEEYINGNVKVHEKTLSHKEQKSMNRILERKAMIKPILLSYPTDDEMESLLKSHIDKHNTFFEVELKSKGTYHKFWRVKDSKKVKKIRKLFKARIKTAYIADGHHRSYVSQHLYEMTKDKKGGLKFDKLYCAFFGFDQLRISEFNRVISVLDEVSPTRIIAHLSNLCKITSIKEVELPEKPHHMTMLIRGEYFKLEWNKEVLDEYSRDNLLLDPAIFNDFICREIFGIEDVRSDSRINYIKGAKGIQGVLDSTDYDQDVAFFLYPLNFDQFKHCSDNNILLPPKSTYFEPRMKNGLLAQPY